MTTMVKAKEINWVNVVERALATAAEGFLAVWVMTDLSTLESAATAGAAAALSVLKTAVVEWNSKLEKI